MPGPKKIPVVSKDTTGSTASPPPPKNCTILAAVDLVHNPPKKVSSTDQPTSIDLPMPITDCVQQPRPTSTTYAANGALACTANDRDLFLTATSSASPTDNSTSIGATTSAGVIQPRHQHPVTDVSKGPLARHLAPFTWCLLVWNAMVTLAFVADATACLVMWCWNVLKIRSPRSSSKKT